MFQQWINEYLKTVETEKQNGTLTAPPIYIPYLTEMVNNSIILIKGCAGAGDQFISLKWLKELKKNNNTIHYFPSKHKIEGILEQLDYIDKVFYDNYVDFKLYDYWCLSNDAVYCIQYEQMSDIDISPHLPCLLKQSNKVPVVGLKFIGDIKYSLDSERRFSVDKLIEVIEPYKDNINFVNVDLDRRQLEVSLPSWIQTPGLTYDWHDTMKLISSMDMVVSSCTGIAHLSCGMGIKTLIVVPHYTFWMWDIQGSQDKYGGEYTWFYKNTKLITKENGYLNKISNYIEELYEDT